MSNQQDSSSKGLVTIITALIGVIGTVAVAFFAFRGSIEPKQLEIHATQTSESLRSTQMVENAWIIQTAQSVEATKFAEQLLATQASIVANSDSMMPQNIQATEVTITLNSDSIMPQNAQATQTPYPTYTPYPTTVASTFTSTPIPMPLLPIGTYIIPTGHSLIGIDSICDFYTEYNDATRVTFQDYGGQIGEIYFKHDREFLYVCMKGSTNNVSTGRFITVEFSNNTDQIRRITAWPNSGKTSADQGIIGWSASVAETSDNDMAEFRIPINTIYESSCYTVFRMSVFHYWMSQPGDDYSWPNSPGIGYNDPSVWAQVALDCNS